jgi:acyl-CoA thioester hydrolase
MALPDTPTAAPAATTGAAPAPGFSWPVRVYYEDTDAGGVVYYANYLRFFERCRSEWMRALGFNQKDLADSEGVVFVVAAAEIRFLRPARLDDELRIDARLAECFASHVVFEQQAWRGTELLSRVRVKVVCVDSRTMRPKRIPAALSAVLDAVLDAVLEKPPTDPGSVPV